MDNEIVAAVVGLGIIAVPILAILLVSDWLKTRGLSDDDRQKRKKDLRRETRWSLFALPICVGFAVLLAVIDRRLVKVVLIAVISIPVAIFVGLIVYDKLRYRRSIRAVRMAASGDVDGAITYLKAELQLQPHRADLWNTLAVILNENERHDEALAVIEEADDVIADPDFLLGTRIAVYWNVGRRSEAADLQAGVYHRHPNDFNAASALCSMLIELDRIDDARECFSVAESVCKTETVVYPPGEKARRREVVASLRDQLSGRNGSDRITIDGS